MWDINIGRGGSTPEVMPPGLMVKQGSGQRTTGTHERRTSDERATNKQRQLSDQTTIEQSNNN